MALWRLSESFLFISDSLIPTSSSIHCGARLNDNELANIIAVYMPPMQTRVSVNPVPPVPTKYQPSIKSLNLSGQFSISVKLAYTTSLPSN